MITDSSGGASGRLSFGMLLNANSVIHRGVYAAASGCKKGEFPVNGRTFIAVVGEDEACATLRSQCGQLFFLKY